MVHHFGMGIAGNAALWIKKDQEMKEQASEFQFVCILKKKASDLKLFIARLAGKYLSM